ncbi:MAG TPA: HAMP domain-containing sensor histidine kinase, partial [Bacteroidales bacterium]|nr:HAMP domain-containing sensor histidine kinase [Bacteroidales bacterium]
DLMQARAEDKDLLFSVEAEPNLPPVKAAPEHIKRLWTNLISNAIKYTEPGGIVVVTLSQNPNYVVGTVRDTGIGMSKEQMAHLFEEFYRTEEAKAMDPYFSRAAGIPTLLLFDPPDQISHQYFSFFSWF